MASLRPQVGTKYIMTIVLSSVMSLQDPMHGAGADTAELPSESKTGTECQSDMDMIQTKTKETKVIKKSAVCSIL